jgi:integrase
VPLSDSAIRGTKPAERPQRLADERGLYLLLNPDGSRWWRLDYRFGGKRKTLSLGVYPDVSLKVARERRDAARVNVANGIDPSAKRRAEKEAAVDSFEAVGREWFAKVSPRWASSHADKVIRRLERDVFPWIGARAIGELIAKDVLDALRRIEARDATETAHRAMQNCGQVFRYAVATGRARDDVTRDLRGALTPWKPQHYPSITDPTEVGALLRTIRGFTGSNVVAAALKLAPLVFTRPGELRQAEWSEIDLETAEWNIPAVRMKLRQPHLVPLSKQAVAILRDLHRVTGNGRYVFPGHRSSKRPLSDMAMNAALRRMGYDKGKMTSHGYRAMARTILDEVLGFRPDFIEHQLAHAVRDPNGRAYNRTAHLPERREMMQKWADYLDKLERGGEVVPIRGKKFAESQ